MGCKIAITQHSISKHVFLWRAYLGLVVCPIYWPPNQMHDEIWGKKDYTYYCALCDNEKNVYYINQKHFQIFD